MLNKSREDELLTKLKSCLGSVQAENTNTKDLNAIKNTYCSYKENNKSTSHYPYKQSAHEISHEITSNSGERYGSRQPLAPSKYNSNYSFPTQPVHQPGAAIYSSIDLNHHDFNRKYGKPSSAQTEEKPGRRYEYGLGMGLQKILQQKCQMKPYPNLNISYPHKELPSARDAIPLNAQLRNEYRSKQAYEMKRITKNYREQVEQRKQFIENGGGNPLHIATTSHRSVVPGEIKKVNKQNFIPSCNRQPVKSIPSMKTNRQVPQRQHAQKANGTTQCTAMSKLHRITELNEKINDRIRNIISVFECQK